MKSKSMELYDMKAEVLKALAHPLRLAIVEYLGERERCVCEIAAHVGAGRSNISHHLALMVRSGLLAHRKEGLNVYYRLRAACVLGFLACVNGVILEQARQANRLLNRV